MSEASKLCDEIKQLNKKVNLLNTDANKLRINARIQNYKAITNSDEIIKVGRVVNQLNCKIRKINHEVCDPNNDVQKIRDKAYKFNEKAEQLRDEIHNQLRMLRHNRHPEKT